LELFIARMERRYGCCSRDLAEELTAGRIPESAEVVRWLDSLDFLRELNTPGATTGIPMASTRRS
jgi:hypothetical protein